MLNSKVLMSSAAYFDDAAAINPFMNNQISIDRVKAQAEHDAVRAALQTARVQVDIVDAPVGCQDGVYTANWALVRGDKAIMSNLPQARKNEESYAEAMLRSKGKAIIKVPDGVHFSGQGDALPCGNYLLAGSGYRTDPAAHAFLAEALGFEVVSLQAIPLRDSDGAPLINASSGWPDSFFYDIDLAIAVLREDLIAWCPEAFEVESQEKIRALPMDKIEVSYTEATEGFACNLVSTGETVIMSAHALNLQRAIESYGLQTITPEISELAKGGGYIRCTTLTLV